MKSVANWALHMVKLYERRSRATLLDVVYFKLAIDARCQWNQGRHVQFDYFYTNFVYGNGLFQETCSSCSHQVLDFCCYAFRCAKYFLELLHDKGLMYCVSLANLKGKDSEVEIFAHVANREAFLEGGHI